MFAHSRKNYDSWLSSKLEKADWNVDKLLESCHNHETDYLEFKATIFLESASDLQPNETQDDLTWHTLKAIIALANGSGGCVLLGVDDKGHPVKMQDRDGQELTDDTWDDFTRSISELLFKKTTLSLHRPPNKKRKAPDENQRQEPEDNSRKILEMESGLMNLVEFHKGSCHGQPIVCLLVKPYGKEEQDYFIVKEKQLNRQIVYVRRGGEIGETVALTDFKEIQRRKRPHPPSWISTLLQSPVISIRFALMLTYILISVFQIVVIYKDIGSNSTMQGLDTKLLVLMLTAPVFMVIHTGLRLANQKRALVLSNIHCFLYSFVVTAIFYYIKLVSYQNLTTGSLVRVLLILVASILSFWSFIVPVMLPNEPRDSQVNPDDIIIDEKILPHYTISNTCIDAKLWWTVKDAYEGWELQKHKVTGHYRILDNNHERKCWGKAAKVRPIFNDVKRQIKALIDSQSHPQDSAPEPVSKDNPTA